MENIIKFIKNKSIIRASAFVLFFFIILGICLIAKNDEIKYLKYNEFISNVEEKNVESAVLSNKEKFTFRLFNDDTEYETDNPRKDDLKEYLLTNDISVTESNDASKSSMIQSAISLIFFCVAGYAAYRMLNKQTGKVAERIHAEQADEEQTSCFGFSNVAGNEEAKESVMDIVDFIKNPGKYSKYGARMPRGVMFYGPPGTGKTLMAKAVAGEAGVPFYAVSGSDFVQMYVGVGAGRVRDLFKKAREHGKAVIFIDEIDALGKKRSGTASGSNDEREQTLNALLTEMSGFSSGEGIVVIAATNRLDTLDEALLRPGRFDRQVEIGLPDINGRKMILNLHAQDKPLARDIDMDGLARQTIYFSGAMLENLLNEAAISAAKKGAGIIETSDINTAYYTVIAGNEKKDRSGVKEKERRITAIHESGHALVAKIVSPDNIVSKITIIPSTKGAGGFCVNIPPEKMYYTKKELEAQIMVSLAGRAAEEIIFGEDNVTTGASNDIEKATSIIRDFVAKFGMSSSIGLINANIAENGKLIFDECSKHLDKLYKEVKHIINANLHKLNGLADALIAKETLDEDEISEIIQINHTNSNYAIG